MTKKFLSEIELLEKNIIIIEKPFSDLKQEFYYIPNWLHDVFTDIGLKPTERLVYECLLRFGHNSKNPIKPSYDRISKFTGVKNRSSISKALKRLQEYGLVKVIHKGVTQGDSSIYKIYFPYRTDKLNFKDGGNMGG